MQTLFRIYSSVLKKLNLCLLGNTRTGSLWLVHSFIRHIETTCHMLGNMPVPGDDMWPLPSMSDGKKSEERTLADTKEIITLKYTVTK